MLKFPLELYNLKASLLPLEMALKLELAESVTGWSYIRAGTRVGGDNGGTSTTSLSAIETSLGGDVRASLDQGAGACAVVDGLLGGELV